MTSTRSILRVCATIATVNLTPIAIAQSATVNIDSGQSFTPDNLAVGEFLGQSFTLGADLTFEVNDGGTIGPVSPNVHGIFNLWNSTLNINSGGSIESGFHNSVVLRNGLINIFDGARLGQWVVASSGSTVNIWGGNIGTSFRAAGDVNIYGGLFEQTVYAEFGGTVNISGGVLGRRFNALQGSNVNITGGQFDWYDAYNTNISNISGGNFKGLFIANSGSTINISGDTSISNLVAYSDSKVAISGGIIERLGSITDGAHITITSGSIGDFSQFESGSTANISGGRLGRNFRALSGSSVTFSGGEFQLNGVSTQVFSGGLPSEGVFTGTLADGSVFIFSADDGDRLAQGAITLQQQLLPVADTTPMVVSSGEGPMGLRPGQTLTLTQNGSLRDNFVAVDSSVSIQGGTAGNRFEAAYSDVSISGGTLGDQASVYAGSTVRISGGTIGDNFSARSGSVVSISDGSVGDRFQINAGSITNISGGTVGRQLINYGTVNISGGMVGDFMRVMDSGTTNITGGVIGDNFVINGTTNVSGGTIGNSLLALPGSFVNLSTTELFLDNTLIDLAFGESLVITQRDGALLAGTLADGTFFDFTLNDIFVNGQDYFDANATLTVTLVPTPGAIALFALGGLLSSRRRES